MLKKKKMYLLQGVHANSSYRWRSKNSLLMNYTLLLLWYFLYLIRKCCLPKFQIFFSICQNSLQGTSQKFLIEVLGCPHQGWERHGHLHFHPGKVLQQRNYYGISTTWKHFNRLLQHHCSGHDTLLLTDTWSKKRKHQFCEKGCHREVITINLWCYWLHNLRTEFLVAGKGSPAKVLVFSPPCAQGPWTRWRSTPSREQTLHSRHLLLVWAGLKTEVTVNLLLSNH